MVRNRVFPQISSELMLVLKCTKTNVAERDKISALLTQELDLDWDLFLRLAMEHRVFPLVYKTLSSLEKSAVPEQVLKTLQQEYRKNAMKAMSMTGEMIRIIRCLEENEIQPLVLKGSPLALKLYDDIALRPSNDIDILVDAPRKFERAEKILEQVGYTRYSPEITLTPRQLQEYQGKHHHFAFYNFDCKVCVELHWKTKKVVLKDVRTSSNLSRQKVDVGGYQVPVMEDEEWLLYLMEHGCNHMWFRLRWLCDIERFMQKIINWDKMLMLADFSGLRPVLIQSIILVNELLAVPIPERLQQYVANEQKAWELADLVIKNLSNNEVGVYNSRLSYLRSMIIKTNYYLKLIIGLPNKLSYIFSIFKPSEIEFKLITLPDSLYPIYYLIRPCYWVRRRVFFSKRNTYS